MLFYLSNLFLFFFSTGTSTPVPAAASGVLYLPYTGVGAMDNGDGVHAATRAAGSRQPELLRQEWGGVWRVEQ